MAVHRALYQSAHLAIVIFYTLFCAAVLGLDHPIHRFVAALLSAVPVIWGVWVLSFARVPVETIAERVEEELEHETTNPRYLRLRGEIVALSRDVREMDRIAAAAASGAMAREEAFRELNRIERRMKQRVERMREVADVSSAPLSRTDGDFGGARRSSGPSFPSV